jgi:glucan phosphoethanolaminetransferase (alkaline phosphatase superfamily)
VPRVPAADLSVTARRAWLMVTAAGVLFMTAFDAALLQQKKAFFTGGFLAAAHTRGVAEALAFLGASLCSDAAAVGLLAAVALALTARLRLTTSARMLAALIIAVAPLLLADFVTYRLTSYLGDAFDLSLLFDLTGRKPQELAAVASAHLVAPLLLLGTAGGVAGGLVWLVNRFGRRAATTMPVRVPVLFTAIAVAVLGISVTAAATTWNETLDDGLGRKPSGQFASWLAERVTDVDRDGFGLGHAPADPDPFNAAVYPYAVDVPGNGIDEDGVGGDLPAGAPQYSENTAHAPWQRKPNVVLIVLESFRADALGQILNGKPVTPVLDALGKTGIATSRALSHNGYTAQSRFHIFSGSLAGLRGGTSLIDDFKANGYEVAYFSGQDDSFGGAAYSVGMDRADVAYDARQDRKRRYTTFSTAGSLAVPFDVVQERVDDFLEHRHDTRPLFLYINFHDTHYPYHRDGLAPLVSTDVLSEARIAPSRAAVVKNMYFNTAANVDAAIGKTLDTITRRLGARPAIVATADHGESLFDEGFLGHGYALNDVQTRIPLVVTGLPITIEEPFGQSDLRDAIDAAMAAAPGSDAPRLVSRPDKTVFQYLGRIDKPREIAFASDAARTMYDFRTRRVRVADGAWVRPEALTGNAAPEFQRLIRTWERMMIARAGATNGDGGSPPGDR